MEDARSPSPTLRYLYHITPKNPYPMRPIPILAKRRTYAARGSCRSYQFAMAQVMIRAQFVTRSQSSGLGFKFNFATHVSRIVAMAGLAVRILPPPMNSHR